MRVCKEDRTINKEEEQESLLQRGEREGLEIDRNPSHDNRREQQRQYSIT